jgi:hypothetical protein
VPQGVRDLWPTKQGRQVGVLGSCSLDQLASRSDGLAAPRLRLTTKSAATRQGAWLIEALAGWMLDRDRGGAATAPPLCSGLRHRSQTPVAAVARA